MFGSEVDKNFTSLASEITVKISKLRNFIFNSFSIFFDLISSLGSIFDDETF